MLEQVHVRALYDALLELQMALVALDSGDESFLWDNLRRHVKRVVACLPSDVELASGVDISLLRSVSELVEDIVGVYHLDAPSGAIDVDASGMHRKIVASLLSRLGPHASDSAVPLALGTPHRRDQREVPSAPEVTTPAELPTTTTAAHSSDFRSVRWFGEFYAFTANQAPVVRLLWQNWQERTPEVGNETLLEAVDHEAPPARLDTLFRDHPAWGTMIVAGGTKGTHRLAEPAEENL